MGNKYFMGKVKGSKNKQSGKPPETLLFDPGQRVELLAAIIVERIQQDQKAGGVLLKKIRQTYHA